ncbi:hypothetical protein HDU76_010388 [Blyttiomyces sp. JEL0837]|nr:hypothetical protein HDU76_010388 [Blyttiomyces sp. JEL0837]
MTSSLTSNIIVFSDFDGTLTTRDTGTVVIDACMGYNRRRELDIDILEGRRTFRDAVAEMWNAVNLEWDHAISLVKEVAMDPDFERFHAFLSERRIPLNVVSAGLTPLCNLFLGSFCNNGSIPEPPPCGLSPSDLATTCIVRSSDEPIIKVFANEIVVNMETGWEVIYRDDSEFGHDKGAAIRAIKEVREGNNKGDDNGQKRPLLIFIGDGVSDLSAARHADVVFAKSGKDLEIYCTREGIPHVSWSSLGTVVDWLETYERGAALV